MIKCFLITGNTLCFIVSIACFFLGTDRWHEYLASVAMMIVTLYGFIVSCQINQKLLLSFTALSIIDFLISVADVVLLLILTVKWKKFCRGEVYFEDDYLWTCHDLNYRGYWSFIYAEIVLVFVGLFGRVITAVGAFLLARFYFDDEKD